MPKKSFVGFIDQNNNLIRPLSLDDFNFLLGGFENAEKVTITVESFVREKSLPQMGLLHKYINIIAKDTGNDDATVKIEMKKMFGARKEDGKLKSTADYSTEEMAKLIDGTWHFGITELGLNLPTPEEFKNKNLK